MFLGRLLALLAALASSGTPIFSQALRDDGWTAWQVSGARSTIGFLILAAFLRGRLLLARNNVRITTLMVANSCVGMSAYPYAAMHASLGTTVSMLYLSIAWTVLYQRWHGIRERFDLLTAAMAIVGVASIVGFGSPEDTWQGIAAGLLASVTASILVIVGARPADGVPSDVLACWGLFGGMLAFGWLLTSAPWGTGFAACDAVGMGLVSGAGFMILYMTALRLIKAEARVWLPFDLVFVWAFQTFALGRQPTILSCVGVALIFSAATLLAWGRTKDAKEAVVRPSG